MHFKHNRHPEWEWIAKVPVPLYWFVKTLLMLLVFSHTGHL